MEKRIHPRFKIDVPVTIESNDLKTKQRIKTAGTIINLSLGGIGLTLDKMLPKTLDANLWLDLCPTKPSLSVEAKIKWINKNPKDSTFNHGLKFINPDIIFLKEIIDELGLSAT